MDIVVRQARLDDVPRLLDLYALLDIAGDPSMTVDVARARFLQLTANPRHGIYVAEMKGRVVGTFALVLVGGLPHGGRDSCVVEDVVVAREVQGLGIGRQMMHFAMEHCAEGNCYKLVLSSHLKRAEAHRFYEGLGFSKHGFSFLIDFDGLVERSS